ncbi:MAG: hypothetical protein J6K83_05670 [Bacteroidaceae bacterium]|nr:hypothetical protein [Bacteroidaceae bacterium]
MNTESIGLKRRSLSIDMVKGLSIMTLFFLHFENEWMSTEYNYFIVRSPAFYIVIGWLWGMSPNKKTIKGHWERRKKGLVKPYIWFSIIFLCFDAIMILLQQMDVTILIRDIYKTITLRGIGTLWFLPALLGGEILFIYFRDKKHIIKVLAYSACLLIVFLFNKYAHNLFSQNHILNFAVVTPLRVIKDCSNACIYISIAYAVSSYFGKRIFNTRRIYLLIIGVVSLSIAFCGLNFYSSKYTLLNILNFIIANSFAGFGILFLFRSLEWLKPLSLPLSYCGKNSLTIMAFHFCLLFQLALIIDKNLLGYTNYYGDRTIVYFLIALILQIAIIEIINKKFRFIIGKN